MRQYPAAPPAGRALNSCRCFRDGSYTRRSVCLPARQPATRHGLFVNAEVCCSFVRRGDSCVVPHPGLRASRRKAANTPQLSCPTACTCHHTCHAIANWWRSGLLTSEELADALAPLNENELSSSTCWCSNRYRSRFCGGWLITRPNFWRAGGHARVARSSTTPRETNARRATRGDVEAIGEARRGR